MIEPVELGRFKARLPIQDDILLADEDGIAEAKHSDYRCDLSHMRRVELAELLGRMPKLIERYVSQLKIRKDVIAHGVWRGRNGGNPAQGFAPPSALGLEFLEKETERLGFSCDGDRTLLLLRVARLTIDTASEPKPLFGGFSRSRVCRSP